MSKEELRITQIKDKIYGLGPMLPGTISTQWNVCGKPDCRCKDPKKPQKHGPYYQLSFSLQGKSSTMFIKKDLVNTVKQCQKRYQQFKKLNNQLLEAYIQWARKQGLEKNKEENK